MSTGETSGEIVIDLLKEVRADCKTLTAGQATIQRTLDAGERRMDDLDRRLCAVEKSGCSRLAQHVQAARADDDDWSNSIQKHRPERNQRDVPTDRMGRKVDLTTWIKYGAMIGAAVAGAYAAVKAGGVAP